MKGYVVIDTEVVDGDAYSQYVQGILEVFAAHRGRFLVRTSEVESVHGGWAPKRLVILEFDSLAAAQGFIGSPEYVALDDLRQRGANSHTVVVEGFDS